MKNYLVWKKREDFYRFSMMKPFKQMWNIMNVPLKANQPNGYDVIMATKMLGYLDISNTETGKIALEKLKDIQALQTAYDTLKQCVKFIQDNNLKINADELRFGMYIADPEKLELQKGYCGFGGIPGFIQVSIYPNSYNIPKIPAVIAHEFHHNIRFSYFDWDHGNVTVGDYLIIEGLAESFAKEQGYQPVGLSPFAGYAVGYQAVQSFMKVNNVGIGEATLLDTKEILYNCELFTK